MSTVLEDLARDIRNATTPESVFGACAGGQFVAARKIYRCLARLAHADRYSAECDKQLAHETFVKLSALWVQCQARIKAGLYGTAQATTPLRTVTSPAHTYTLEALHQRGELSNVYRAVNERGAPCLVKVALAPSVNDLLKNEADTLRKLNVMVKDLSVREFIPTLLESFSVRADNNVNLQVNVFDAKPNLHTLVSVFAEYPEGIDQKHFVWIYKRVLSLLGFVHELKLVHSAILPTHLLIEPNTHAICLVDWCFAVPLGCALRAASNAYRSWYPPEVTAKKPVGAGLDLYMAARCMAYLLGDSTDVPSRTESRFRRIIQPCLLGNPNYRSSNAWELYNELEVAARVVYGHARFVKLAMPALEA